MVINLFEYQNKIKHEVEDTTELEAFLDDIWAKREKNSYYDSEEPKEESQKFIQFLHNTKEIKSSKYVGVIHFEGNKINLLPKIFYNKGNTPDKNKINQIHNHIMWWLSYCSKIKFPNFKSSLDSQKSDFFEVIVYLFAKYTRELLNNSLYSQYEEIDRELPYIKGRLNVPAYINENVSRGRWHKLNCTYDSFTFDNEFNQVVKSVTNLLFNFTANPDNKKMLREILFILDEVYDIRATAEQCANLKFNQMFGEYETVKDYCLLFLSNSISFNYKDDLRLFAFLLPMEKVFEDFVYGFINKHLPEYNLTSQSSGTNLVTGPNGNEKFQLKPDLYFEIKDKIVIADTKYKLVYTDETDPKNGISQNDLYQMVAYAIRFEAKDLILFYPYNVKSEEREPDTLEIIDEFSGVTITIHLCQIPIFDDKILDAELSKNKKLSEIFEPLKDRLENKLKGQLESVSLKFPAAN
jgi:5-methylcytosine-specific restriction enzyme subunit McrC